ncbi:MAG: acyl-protein synthetase [Campylobacterota bacterium]|nr:acyl-protein synthetase [Campylobacterota bacterium]
MNLKEYLEIAPYSLEKKDKEVFLSNELKGLTLKHSNKSIEYKSILNAYSINETKFNLLEDFPYLPVRLFKEYDLKSCQDKEIIKTLTSSGTTSQKVSKIYLDKETSTLQTKALIKIMQNYLGKQRLPMLIIDTKSILKDRKMFSARGAGILGLSNFGRKHTYALDENMEIDFEAIEKFLEENKDQKILIFGFTFMIWQYFYEKLKKQNKKLDLSNSILIHSGGWKKLVEKAVDNRTFKSSLKEQIGINNVHDFYGMVEQVGSIFVECECGYLHAPVFADIIIRDKMTLKPLEFGEEGIVEVLSIIPRSYPGHVLLTEDLGVIIGEDDCSCGRKGKYFKINGRLPKAELRGCSDTHAYDAKKEL